MTHAEQANRTKAQLAAALKQKLQTKVISKITVSELIKACNINRNTFYYHFESVYDLLKWMLEQEAIQVVKHFDLLVDYEEAISFVMDYVEENEHILKCTCDAVGRDELNRFFAADFRDVMRSLLDRVEQELGVHAEPAFKEFLCAFYTEALAGMLLDWLRNRELRDRANTARYLVQVLRCSLPGLLSSSAGAPAPPAAKNAPGLGVNRTSKNGQ